MTKLVRAQAEHRGRLAEGLAGAFLQAKGYVILARRAKTPGGEIDLIARRGKVLAFIEVKARTHAADPGRVLHPRQMGRIVRGATSWASARTWTASLQWRYDLIIMQPWRWPIHLKDAFRPERDPTLETAGKGSNLMALQHRAPSRGQRAEGDMRR